MAVALDATTGFYPTNSWSTTARTFSHTVSGSNRYLTVAVYLYQGAGQTATAVSYAGVGMSLLAASQGGGVRTELWGLKAPATGANNVSVQLSAGTNGACAVARSWTDVNQTTPTGTVAIATGTSTSPSVGVTSAAGELVVDACGVLSQSGTAPTATVGTGQAQDSNGSTGFSVQDVFGLASNKAGAASTTMAWSLNTSRPWATIGIPLKPVAAGGGGPVPLGISGVGATVSTALGLLTVTGGVVSGQKYVSTSGSDANSGSSSAPWRTIDYAIKNCANNTTINVGAGTYAKTVLANVVKSGVVVQPSGAVTVTHGGWDLDNTKGITFSSGTGTWLVHGTGFGMTMDGTCADIVFEGISNDDYRSGQWQVSQQTGGMTRISFLECSWANIDASPHFVTNPNSNGPCMLAVYNRTTSPTDILIQGCSWANTIGCDSIQLSAARGTKADGEAHRLTRVTIEDCNFNNVSAGSTPAHSDPIQLVGFTDSVTIRNNQFLQGTRGILCQPNSASKHGDHINLVFENNPFHGRTDFCISCWNCPGVKIVNNTISTSKRYSGTDTSQMNTGIRLNYAWAGATGAPTDDVILRNNIIDNLIVYEKGPGSTNNAQGTLSFASKGNNLINAIGGTYGATAYTLKTGADADVRGSNTIIDSQTFVNKTSGDLRLKAGSPAIGIGNAAIAPDTDADGVIRGNPPDAGALEFLDGTTVLSVRPSGIAVSAELGDPTVTTGLTPIQSVAGVGGLSVAVTIGGAAAVSVGPLGPPDPSAGTDVPIDVAATVAAGQGDANSWTSRLASLDPGTDSNRLLIVTTNVRDTGDDQVLDCTFGGVSLTHYGTFTAGASTIATELWYMRDADMPAGGTAHDVIVELNGSSNRGGFIATVFAGVDQAEPFDAFVSNTGTSTTPTTQTIASASDRLVFSTLMWRGAAAVPTATQDAAQTLVKSLTSGSMDLTSDSGQHHTTEPGDTSVQGAWTLSSSVQWVTLTGSLKQAQAGSGSPGVPGIASLSSRAMLGVGT